MPDWTIQELTPDRAKTIVGVQKTFENFLKPYKTQDQEEIQDFVQRIYNQEGRVFAALTEKNELIGCVTLYVFHFFRDGLKAGYLHEIVTRKGYEGQGVGSALVKRLIEAAKEEGCYKILSETAENLVPFFEKHGFVQKECSIRVYLDE